MSRYSLLVLRRQKKPSMIVISPEAGIRTNAERPLKRGMAVAARFFAGMLVWAGVLFIFGGCAAHYHRVDKNGMTLYLRLPSAENVILFSSLDGFSPHTAQWRDGKWVNSLPADREFRYFYQVDGQLFIPECRLKEKDDFGFENCVYVPGL